MANPNASRCSASIGEGGFPNQPSDVIIKTIPEAELNVFNLNHHLLLMK